MPKSPIITLKNVAVRYKQSGNIFRKKKYHEALKSINLDIYPGETLGILGNNGAGKSTLLQIISGIIKPDKGSVVNYGVSVSLLALQAGFDENLSGRDNAILTGILHGYRRKEIYTKLDAIMEYSELEQFFFEPVRTYSSGMRARLGFSISNIFTPDVLLVDEVLSVGDQHFREKAERTMVQKTQSNQTVVIVSHAPNQIRRLCDRAIIIQEGANTFAGSVDEVVKLYSS